MHKLNKIVIVFIHFQVFYSKPFSNISKNKEISIFPFKNYQHLTLTNGHTIHTMSLAQIFDRNSAACEFAFHNIGTYFNANFI